MGWEGSQICSGARVNGTGFLSALCLDFKASGQEETGGPQNTRAGRSAQGKGYIQGGIQGSLVEGEECFNKSLVLVLHSAQSNGHDATLSSSVLPTSELLTRRRWLLPLSLCGPLSSM